MGKIIAIVNQKGGVWKTTTCVNLSYALHLRGKKVLLCDLDPQGNSTSGFGVDKNTSPNTYDVIMNGENPENAVVVTKFGSIMPTNRELTGALIELVNTEEREFVLKKALAPIKDKYDYIFIDCPPSLELLTLNALCAADSVVVPVQCEYFALEGLSDLVNTIKQVHANLNPDLVIIGLLRVMFDARMTLQQQVSEQLLEHFGDKVFKTIIPRNVRLAEAPSYGLPGVAFDKSSRGAKAYLEFGAEMVERIKHM